MKKNIAVIAGGFSKESGVSRKGAKVVEQNLDRNLYNVFVIFITKKDWYYLPKLDAGNSKLDAGKNPTSSFQLPTSKINVDKNDFSLTIPDIRQSDIRQNSKNLNSIKIKFHCVFNVIHGTPGEDGKLQGYFDLLDIPYINTNLTASAITFNKYFTGIIAEHFGINVPASLLIKKKEMLNVKGLMLNIKHSKLNIQNSLFVKPNKGGSSIGITKVNDIKMLPSALKKAFETDDEVLVEEFIEGTEISCGIIKHKNKIITLPITEIVPKNDYFDYEAKYKKNMSDEITPARISKETENECKRISSELYAQLGCKGMVRMDYIIRNNNKANANNSKFKIQNSKFKLFLLDINTVPGLSEASLIPKQAATAGISLKELYNIVIAEALNT